MGHVPKFSQCTEQLTMDFPFLFIRYICRDCRGLITGTNLKQGLPIPFLTKANLATKPIANS